ncbi:MAG: hypothetical protein HY402_00665 [Elusimicrobia bacterium]|nr:hypothetical protein [Elusimicrobiota bacterium]
MKTRCGITREFFRRSSGLRLALTFSLLLSCGDDFSAWGQELELSPEIQEILKEQQGTAAGSPAAPISSREIIRPETLQPEPASSPRSAMDTTVSVRVRNTSISVFLDAISSQANVNFIIAPGLENKTITAFLEGVTVREALQVLLEVRGLMYQRIGRSNTYVIKPITKAAPQLSTRIYTLEYIPLQRLPGQSGLTPLTSSGSQLISGGASGGGSTGSLGGGSAGGSSGGEGAVEEEIGILKVIRSVLTEKGQVALDPRTNSLIVTDVAEVFPMVDQIVAELDRKAPQVMIEAQIVEIDSNKNLNLGLEWGGPSGELLRYTGPARFTDFPLRPGQFTKRELGRFFPGSLGTDSGFQGGGTGSGLGTFSSSAGGMVFGKLSLEELKVVLRALVARGQGKFLSKPKVVTMNNRPAVIQITANTAIGVQSTAGTQTGIQTVTAERQVTGLQLQVTPQINRNKEVTLLLEPSLTRPESSEFFPGQFVDPQTRGARTLVQVRDGETVVIGGLLDSREIKTVRKVPFFGHIPLVGLLFTSVENRRSATDLVIFVTPSVLE